MTKHLQNCGPNTQAFDPVSLAWVAQTHPQTEPVFDEASGTWSDVPVVEEPTPTPTPKKKAKKKVSKKK